jgi:hypothetical protein
LILETFQHQRSSGWSVPRFPDLDSEQTLLLVFGAPSYAEDSGALLDLERAYPLARRLGCSTSGEIFQDRLFDDSLSVALLRFASTEIRTATARIDTSQGS